MIKQEKNMINKKWFPLLATTVIIIGSAAITATSSSNMGTIHASQMSFSSSGKVQKSTSPNWAGVEATGGKYWDIQADWTVPSAACGKTPNATASIWTGLGSGTGSDPIFQDGIDVVCSKGAASYSGWWEIYTEPDLQSAISNCSPQSSGCQILPGDEIDAEVSLAGGQEFYMDDYRGGALAWSWSTPFASTVTRSQLAECVIERPTLPSTGALTKLSDFGTATFTNCAGEYDGPNNNWNCGTTFFIQPGATAPCGGSYSAITMTATNNQKRVLADVSGFTVDGGFNAYWRHRQ